MSWSQGWCPWGDPVSDAQERMEAMLRREDALLATERVAEQRKGNDDRQTESDPDQRT